jgi:hypothetical protein
MLLDELLERSATVPPREGDARQATRDRLLSAAHADVVRRARIVRLRRTRAVLAGLAATAVVGVTVVSHTGAAQVARTRPEPTRPLPARSTSPPSLR